MLAIQSFKFGGGAYIKEINEKNNLFEQKELLFDYIILFQNLRVRKIKIFKGHNS